MPGDLERRTWQPADVATRDECAAARKVIAAHATDSDDEQRLLQALGLAPNEITEHGMPGYRAGCRCPVCRKANRSRCAAQRARHATTVTDAPINTTTGEHQ
jgi:hypothetical protein